MAQRPRSIFLILLAIIITASPWDIMQSVAWASMLVNDFRTQSILQSVEHTFDGRHPCPLCRAIAASRKSGKHSEFVAGQTRLEFLPSPAIVVIVTPERSEHVFAVIQVVDSLSRKPAVPPPRAILA
ncbi:MAG TPA: hypothetical protein VMD30_03975 [Tepidisphaeraceae bacterium]|nr:hypothetical protein [Tepidisphaeraceae bacterium]